MVLSCSIFLSSSDVFPKSFLIFVNNYSVDFTSDSPLASLSSKLSFHASTILPYTYNNIQATWVATISFVIFILIYRQATLTNMFTSSIFLLKTWDLATSTLLLYCWKSMMLTYCCKVTIMARSCFSLVWWGIPSIAVVVGETYAIAIVMVMIIVVIVMIPCRRMDNLFHLYL